MSFVYWPGYCEVHVLFSAKKLFTLKEENPGALVLAHPECEDTVLAHSDFIDLRDVFRAVQRGES